DINADYGVYGFVDLRTYKSVENAVCNRVGTVIGTDGPNVLSGPYVYGLGGDDTLKVSSASGTGTLNGGLGNDTFISTGPTTLHYSSSAAPVKVTLDGVDDDGGAAGDHDHLVGDSFVVGIIGSPLNDTLVGNALDNVIDGGLGADDISGRGG